MSNAVLWLILMAMAHAGFSQGMRFSLPREQVDVEASLAQPGDLPVPLSATNINLEILNWQTSLTPTPERGQFLLKLRSPARVGSILLYGNADVSAGSANRWTKLAAIAKGPDRLRLLALHGDALVESIKLTAPPQKQPDNSGFRAVIPFMTLLPVQATNIAPTAEISATARNPELLVDGIAEETQTVIAEVPASNSSAWIKLTWKEP